MSLSREKYLEWGIAIALILVFTFQFDNSEVFSPDGKLYYSLGHNLVDGDGYVDNVRNDYIIAPFGHPLMILTATSLGVDSPLAFARILLFFGLIFIFLTTIELNIPKFYRLSIIPLTFFIVPTVYDWGVEMSIFFSINLMLYCFTRFAQKYTIATAVVLGLSIALNLLIRPVFGPFLYLLLAMAIFFFVKFKLKTIPFVISVLVPILIVNSVAFTSKSLYGDKRLSAGTYSEIPLYCANNNYIELQSAYYSGVWNEISEEERIKGVAPLKLKTTWQDRAQLLRQEVLSFYQEHPDKAIKGIFWRSLRFTIKQPNGLGMLLFWIWLGLGSLILVFNGKRMFSTDHFSARYWVGLLVPAYSIAILSLFVYVGERYNLTPNLLILHGILLFVSIMIGSKRVTSGDAE